MFLGIILIATAFLTLGCQNRNDSVVFSNNIPHREATREGYTSSANGSVPTDIKEPRYLGCWRGMNGGSIRITGDKIYDLGSSESSSYREMTDVQTPSEGLQTGEKYLLEAEQDFPKSFLAKFLQIAFNSDRTVGFGTYDSYEDYLQKRFAGQGLFEKSDCSTN